MPTARNVPSKENFTLHTTLTHKMVSDWSEAISLPNKRTRHERTALQAARPSGEVRGD